MADTLYIHLSPFGTRTLEFQAFLFYNSILLERKGLLFPRKEDNMTTLHYHGQLAQSLIGYRANEPDPWDEFIETIRTAPGAVILSSDLFYQTGSGSLAFFQALKEKLAYFKVYGLFFLRRMDFWLETLYLHSLYNGESLSLSNWLSNHLQTGGYLDMRPTFFNFQKIFGYQQTLLRLCPPESDNMENIQRGLAQTILKLLGTDISEEFGFPRFTSGPTLGPKAALFIQLLNKQLSSHQQKNWAARLEAYKKIQQHLNPLRPPADQLQIFSARQQRTILRFSVPLYEDLRPFLPEEERADIFFFPQNLDMPVIETFPSASLSAEETLQTVIAIGELLPISLRHLS